MVCALSLNYQHPFEQKYMHLKANCPGNSKMALKFYQAKQFMDQNSQNVVLIINSRTNWPT